jgi:hypothetical protein
MSTDRDTTRIVRSWLRTDDHESADRVLGSVLDRLDTTPQRRGTWWPARRLPEMNNTAKLALGAAAVVVVALIGFSVLVGPGTIGGPDISNDSTPEQATDADEALIRAWVDAVNRGDRESLLVMTADRVATADRGDLSAEEIADYVLGSWCPMGVGDIERVGDSFILSVTFTDNADSSCTDGAPGTSGQIVIEVRDGKVSRIP